MDENPWSAVDAYLQGLYAPADSALTAALQASAAAGLPEIHITPVQGRFLSVLAQALGAQTILEVGTLGGYSTIWLARALPPGGRLTSLELNPQHAEVARANLARAGLSQQVEVRVGAALDSLPQLQREGRSFDLVFIDADKPNLVAYFDWAVRLSRPGSLIVTDNVIRKGKVTNPASDDPAVQGVRAFHAAVAADPRVTAAAIQTVGAKGHDGFSIARVTGS
jgi:predicted O-methyltransferase YrrM